MLIDRGRTPASDAVALRVAKVRALLVMGPGRSPSEREQIPFCRACRRNLCPQCESTALPAHRKSDNRYDGFRIEKDGAPAEF
jgi:hypothetical protein